MGKDEGGETTVTSTTPPWMDNLGEWSSGKFQDWMGKQENYSPYPDMKNPYGEWKSLFSDETGKNYLDAFSAAPKAAYNQALTDTKNMFGAKGMYGSAGNGLMSGAMASAGENYSKAMSDAQIKAQNAQAMDYYTSAEGRKWANENAKDKLNYENTMKQQIIQNLLGGMGITIPTIAGGQLVETDDGGSGKGGLGSMLGGIGSIAGAFTSTRAAKEPIGPAESVLEKVESLPVQRWRYKPGFGDEGEHVGPYAEDWAERFGGTGNEISIIDAVGVLLKAVRELADKVRKLEEAA